MDYFLHYGGSANLEHVNPNFDRSNSGLTDPHNINCVSCAIATDAHLSGIRVCAFPYDVKEHIEAIQNFYGRRFFDILIPGNICGRDESTRAAILSEKMTEIKDLLIKSGEKSRFIIYVKTIRAGGHVFNAWNKGGVIEFLDGQNNKVVNKFQSPIGVISLLQTGFTSQE
jgi:Papain fold toxin 1, glutamine deamidase